MIIPDIGTMSLSQLKEYIENINYDEFTAYTKVMYFCIIRDDYMDAFRLLVNQKDFLHHVSLTQERYYSETGEETSIIEYLLDHTPEDLIIEMFKHGQSFMNNEMYHLAGKMLEYYEFKDIRRINPEAKFESTYYICNIIQTKKESKHIEYFHKYLKYNPNVLDIIDLLKGKWR